MRYLSLNEALELYRRVMEQSGGMVGIRIAPRRKDLREAIRRTRQGLD
jgi:hypothetical protein